MITRYKTKSAKRKVRIRSRITSTSTRPRLSVFRSNKSIYAQIIDDQKGITLASVSSLKLKDTAKKTKTQVAQQAGEELGKIAKTKKISTVVFDRGQYKYHGRVKALAQAARKTGLKF